VLHLSRERSVPGAAAAAAEARQVPVLFGRSGMGTDDRACRIVRKCTGEAPAARFMGLGEQGLLAFHA
jgi:hypothetical protein